MYVCEELIYVKHNNATQKRKKEKEKEEKAVEGIILHP